MNRFWKQGLVRSENEVLRGEIATEVAVVGGGIAGILTAFKLQRAGVRTVLLEQGAICGGQTGGTTAKITAQHGLIYKHLCDNFSLDEAKMYSQLQLDAVEEFFRIADEGKIDCDLVRTSTALFSRSDYKALSEEFDACLKVGQKVYLSDNVKLPVKAKAALYLENQAVFHPLKFLYKIAEKLKIYEGTKVERIEGGTLYTEKGKVRADKIVFTPHYPFFDSRAAYYLRMHQSRTYGLVLENAAVEGAFLEIDGEGLSLRMQNDRLILSGESHRTGEHDGESKFAALHRSARDLFPQSKVVSQFSAQDCMTHDCLPFVGKYSKKDENAYLACGFNKWGMTNSMAAAQVLCDLITESAKKPPSVFDPQRITFFASMGRFLKDAGVFAKSVLKENIAISLKNIDDVQTGCGEIIEYNGKRVGAYKKSDSEIFLVDLKCPHKGCSLEWNPDLLSWDCPCHGSRFDYTGKCLATPAIKSLHNISYKSSK